nr:hypothetical protein [uncultured Agathobaculum sp.]
MDEQNNRSDQTKPEKKLSRTTLTFYIIGLFSVAIALILISYVAQARADRQLDTLTDQLTEQQTVAQGATQKMEELQIQLDEMSAELNNARRALGMEQNEQITSDAATQVISTNLAVKLLLSAEHAARIGDNETLESQMWQLEDSIDPETQLVPEAEGGLLTEEQYMIYQQLTQLLETQEQQ